MKIYFMKEEALYYFKTNVEIFKYEYLNKDNNWIIEKYKSFKGESPFSEFKLEVPDFTLETNEEKPEYTDFNNVKKLYDALKDLSNIRATDERLWAGLAHYNFWNYMLYRGKFTNDIDKNKILSDFFFQSSKRRNLITHSLSRLWWIGRLTYDKKRQNPYEALEYLKTDFRTKVLSLFSSNFTSNPKIVRAILIAISEIEQNGNKVNRESFLELIRYVNLLGGMIILDYLSEEELKNKIIEHYYKQ